jgi:hypothetical protein
MAGYKRNEEKASESEDGHSAKGKGEVDGEIPKTGTEDCGVNPP